MKRVIWPLCAVAALWLTSVIGCAGCPDGSDAPSYRTVPQPANPNRPGGYKD